ncbi:DNA topoisomerase [Elasticomyces elasticus]|nr:DNA topoisomerase [Elasticomyces elasticus]
MTSVAGHLNSQDFEGAYKSWNGCSPDALFEAPITTYVENDKKAIATNIETQARYASVLFIWTDCDREGEHIGTEIRETALKGNRRLEVRRARFSNIERAHILSAAQSPIHIDENQANAVAARIELDLRIGASFTRMQTLTLRPLLEAHGMGEEVKVLSYGSCQFPTLGFVVERYFRVKNFVPEAYWSIKVMHLKDDIRVNFTWSRGHLFDRLAVFIIFERCLAAGLARVTKVETKPTSKWKPLPLTTVELQKCGSRFLRMDSQRVMKIAEDLYTKGWISYPRTETDQFDEGIDLRSIVQKQVQGHAWGQFAQGLLDGGFNQPRAGRNNDKAHPPIHPVNFVDPPALANDEERRVHEFIVRRFLACCSQDARGSKSTVSIAYGSESFTASGLQVLERNYLDVYPYDKWTSTQQLPDFVVGETFEPTEAFMREGKTSPPGYLTEPDLIALMDANGIGTDATMAEHIAKIKTRQYVSTRPRGRVVRAEGEDGDDVFDEEPPVRGARGRGRGCGARGRGGGDNNTRGNTGADGVQEFIPTTLGVALVQGYDGMGFDISLTKPFLRKEMELKMKAICENRTTRREVVQQSLEMYREVYVKATRQMDVLRDSFRRYVFNEPPTG